MPTPIVSWKLANNTAPTLCDFGTIDAGSVSATPLEFNLWNNQNGSSALSNCEGCKLTTKDNATGDMLSEPVKGKWVEVKGVSASEHDFFPIGSTYIPPVGASPASYTEVAHNVFSDDSAIPHQVTTPSSPTDKMLWIDTTNNATTGNVMRQYDATGAGSWNVANVISGKINDGTLANSKANYTSISLRANIPSSAPAGTFLFVTR